VFFFFLLLFRFDFLQILLTYGADIYAEGAKILGRTALVGAAERVEYVDTCDGNPADVK
jgi:hypothetical protein